MKYRKFIEDWFEIDEPKSGLLVPFRFNKVQNKYYEQLCASVGGEENLNLSKPLREIILKARKEGFTSFILALFAADMLLNPNPTTTIEISYKDDATKQHFKRYRGYIESYYRKKGVLDMGGVFQTDSKHEIVLRDNKATFYVGTANARVGERGSTVQKLLFSEAAHYPSGDALTADEIINAGMRQVDAEAGWIFIESTANGDGNTYANTWHAAERGESRFKPRFFGWPELYSRDQFRVIASEFTNKDMLKQEYPATPEEAFIAFTGQFFKEFRRDLHVCEPKPIYPHYRKFMMGDYGYSAPAAVYWSYVDENGVLNIYRELYGSGFTYRALGKEMSQMTPATEKIEYACFDPAIWSKKGENDENLTGADILQAGWKEERGTQIMLVKGDNSRVIGWNALREYLKPDMRNGEEFAKVQIWTSCPNLIRTMGKLLYDPNHPEDCDTKGEDHGPDAVRYGVMSKPPISPNIESGVGSRLGRLLNGSNNAGNQKSDSYD